MNSDDDKTRTHVVLTKETMVSHYRIIEKIGAGGMGEVYLAEDTKLDRRVALKFLPAHLCKDDDCRSRFKREAQAVAKLNHPNIVTIFEVSEYKGRPFFAMEHVEGDSLRDVIKSGKLKLDTVIDLAKQILDGLNKAHQAGVIHRDIKPANIVIDADGRPKILDFGLATIKGGETITKTGSTLGTIRYMSPEQARGEKVDHHSDLFSFGSVLYEMITGKAPFKGEHEAEEVYNVIHETPQPLARFCSDVPNELQRIVSKLLERDLRQRYQTALDVVSDLRRLSTEVVSTAPAPRTDWWNRYIVVGAAVIIVAMAGYGLFSRFGGNQSETSADASIKMLAVLPFENLGPTDEDYFADGMTEEITARLAGVSGLAIIARTSILKYKGTEKSIQQIGKELNVDYILEGTIRWEKSPNSPDRVRVTPQLIKVSDATHLWADVFDQSLTSVFQVQADIAAKVVSALDMTLVEPERQRLSLKPTDNVEAYDLYLQANEYFNEGPTSGSGMKLAAQLYRKAIEFDPDFATAHARLGRALLERYYHTDKRQQDLEQSKVEIDLAMALSPEHVESQIAMGVYYYHQGELDSALWQLTRARIIQPNNSDLIAEIGYAKWHKGDLEGAIVDLNRSAELDPRSSVKYTVLASLYMLLHRFEEGGRFAERASAEAPERGDGLVNKAWLYFMRDGDIEKALSEVKQTVTRSSEMTPWNHYFCGIIEASAGNYETALSRFSHDFARVPGANYYLRAFIYGLMSEPELKRLYYDSARMILEPLAFAYPDNAMYHSGLGVSYGGLGRKLEAIREVELALSNVNSHPDYHEKMSVFRNMALAYTLAGDPDSAIDQLEWLLSNPTWYTSATMRVNPFWISLSDHPKFIALMEKYEASP